MGLFSIIWLGGRTALRLELSIVRHPGRSARRQPACPGPSAETGRWRLHLVGQSQPSQEANGEPGVVDLPPAMTVARRTRIGVMVVVPAFAVGDEADNQVVAAVLVGLVVPVAPQLRHRIDSPGNMPDQYRANEDAEHQDAKSGLRRCCRRFD